MAITKIKRIIVQDCLNYDSFDWSINYDYLKGQETQFTHKDHNSD